MSTPDDMFQQYYGQFVPRSFNPGFVVLSFLVSLIGSISTLELLNRRTSRNGLLNHVFLVTAAVAMGGIAIWSMHYVGNRAIVLAQDQPELQIVYSSKFTAVSFFLPIIVLLPAFVATGTNNHISFWRIGGGGTLAGGAICGMHYIGNASIENYSCRYDLANVIGSAIIAVAASNAALSIFFLWRASWTNSWWKRGLSGVVLASAVSGMHWCASTGTNYRLLKLNNRDQFSRNAVVIFVTVLSFTAALIVAGVVVHGAWVARSNASKARHVVLAAAIFDRAGRILVSPEGLVPSEKITDTYIEKTPSDTFSIENPLFQWMFQASRNWNATSGMITSMAHHIAHLAGNGRGRSIRLIRENGQLIEHYDVVFRELFVLAAASLATKLKEQLPNVGVLWDEILPTGEVRQHYPKENPIDSSERGESMSISGSPTGRGSLLFLVRRLENSSDVEKLEAAGYRFADIHQVSSIIRSGMKIKTPDLAHTLADMATYAEHPMMDSAAHLGFFGIRARVSGYGFDVLVERGARNVLPSSKLPLERLEPWHTEFLRQYDRLNVASLHQTLKDTSKKRTQQEADFANVLADAISTLYKRVDNRRILDEATLSYRTVQVPCQPRLGSTAVEECTMIVLHSVIPIHYSLSNPGCEFIPLSFFKIQQMVHKNSPYQAAFTQHLHRELVPTIKGISATKSHKLNGQQAPWERQRDWRSGVRKLAGNLHTRKNSDFRAVDAEGNPIPTKIGNKLSSSSSNQSSTQELWSREETTIKAASHDTLPERQKGIHQQVRNVSSLGGILVSQEIRVAISQVDEVDGQSLEMGRPSRDQGQSYPQHDAAASYPKRSGHTRTRTDSTNAVELESIAKVNADARVRQTLGLTAEASGSVNEVKTFVDELFSACFERR
ncbi:hypothetical protein F5Y12DRAFT_794005 [Xylaria sp. FL1777]|nr:hypothetical protein F5Y12DRAFT_794005 [Xylaria sp. FL1777]